jgi:peptidyl-dipeptidase Dcp
MRHYALHYITEDPLPPELVEKLKKSQTFNQGYNFGEILAASELDMQWHKLTAEAPKQDVDAFEEKALKAAGVDFPNVPPRYRSSYFLHIWANGYASGYYAYTWTEMLADSAYRWFEENGGMTRSNGQRFRNLILSKGHTMDYGPMFKAFLGKDPDIEPLLEQRGLVAKKP